MGKMYKKGFTLVEILIVLGIIGVLSVTLLVALNPGEANRKSRDTKRLKDLTTLSSILGQYVNDNGVITSGCLTTSAGCSSTSGAKNQQSCSSNWLGLTLCAYGATVPSDPDNGTIRTYVSGTGTANAAVYYKAGASGTEYEIMIRQESTSNSNYVVNDGGNSTSWSEGGSNLNILSGEL